MIVNRLRMQKRREFVVTDVARCRAARGGRRVQWSAVSRTAAQEHGARYGCIGNETPAITRARGDKETYKGPIDERRFKVC